MEKKKKKKKEKKKKEVTLTKKQLGRIENLQKALRGKLSWRSHLI